MRQAKSEQLQIRVSPAEKREIKRKAKAAGLDVSSWVLESLLPAKAERFQALARGIERTEGGTIALASMNDFLAALKRTDIAVALAEPPRAKLSKHGLAYLAAMIEHRASQLGATVPSWVVNTGPVEQPYFASALRALRLHLLTHAPPAFRRRNLFVDASVGSRV